MRINLLHVLWKGLGGPERIVLDLTRHLDLKKYNITVAILSRGGCMTYMIDREKILVVEFGAKSGKDLKAMYRFYKFLINNKFDIIHCHERSLIANLSFLAIIPRPILIYHEHGGHLLMRNKITLLTYCFIGRFYDAFIALHSEMVKYMIEASKKIDNKIYIIENSVDVDLFRPRNEHNTFTSSNKQNGKLKIIGIVSRLSPEKDIELFLSVASEVINQEKYVKFIIVGDGWMLQTLQQIAKQQQIDGRIEFLGARVDIPDILNSFDIFLSTSKIEAYGLNILEALACGVPVIKARTELGPSDDILKKLDGILFIENRSPKKIADACIAMLKDKNECKNIGKRGRESILLNYSMKRYVSSIDNLYKSLLNT